MTSAYFRKLRSVPADVWRVIPMHAVHCLSYIGIFAVAFSLYLLRLGYGPSFVAQANSVGVLVYTLAALPSGLVARRWSPRRMMILGALAESGALGLLGVADLIPALWRSGWIMGAETLFGLGAAAWYVSFNPTLMAAAGPAARDQAFALMTAANPLATMAGSLLGGWLPGLLANVMGTTLADPLPFRWALLVGAALVLLAIPPLLRCDAAGASPSRPSPRCSSSPPCCG
jgi:MFS family permease